jgi:hypothetical protein
MTHFFQDPRVTKIPYRLGGSDWDGSDCWGLVRLAYAQEFEIDLPAWNQKLEGFRVPPRGYVADLVREQGQRTWFQVPAHEALPFDVVVLRNLRPSDHCGIVTPDLRELLTTNAAMGSHVCDWSRYSEWASRICGVYRFAG